MKREFTATGFPLIISDLVATASMDLPPLVNEGDSDFLRAMAGKAINLFWSEYLEALPEGLKTELVDAMKSENNETILDWFGRYANFEEDPNARALAEIILGEMAAELPRLMKEDYHAFRSSLAAV